MGAVPLHSAAANESLTASVTRPHCIRHPSRELTAAEYNVEYDWTDEWHAYVDTGPIDLVGLATGKRESI